VKSDHYFNSNFLGVVLIYVFFICIGLVRKYFLRLRNIVTRGILSLTESLNSFSDLWRGPEVFLPFPGPTLRRLWRSQRWRSGWSSYQRCWSCWI